MARIVKPPFMFLPLKLMVTNTVHENQGDTFDINFGSPWTATTGAVKNLLIKGKAIMEFPGSDEPSQTITAPGPVGPNTPFIGKSQIKITILEDNSEGACINPFAGYTLEYEEIDMNDGGYREIPKGALVLMFGENYIVNEKQYSSFEMFAVQYNNAHFNTFSPCHMVIFRAVPKGA